MSASHKVMADLSCLTEVQLDTIKLQKRIGRHEITLQEALVTRKKLQIRKGTHYRILGQAKKNIEKSLLTVAIAIQLGVLKADDVGKLMETVSRIPVDVDQTKLQEIMLVTSALVKRIVMI